MMAVSSNRRNAAIRSDAMTLAEMAFATFGVMFMTSGLNRLIQGHSTLEAVRQESPLVQLTGALIYLVCGVLIGLRYRGYLPILSRNWIITVPISFAFLSIAWSDAPDLTLRRSIALLGTAFFGFYLGSRFRREELALVLFVSLSAMVIGSFLVALGSPRFGVHQAFEEAHSHHAGLWRGLFRHKNTLGPVASICLFTTLAMWRLIPVRSAIKGGVCVVALFVVLKAGSAQALLQAVMFSTAIILHRRFSKFDQYSRISIVMFGMAFAVIVAMFFNDIKIFVLDLLNRDPDLSGRTKIWNAVLIGGSQRPFFGAGYSVGWQAGTDEIALRLNWNDPGHAHNGFLTQWLDLGLVGLGLLVPMWVVYLRRAVLVGRQDHTFYVASLYFFAFYVTTNLADSYLFRHQDIYLLYLVMLMVMNDRLIQSARPQVEPVGRLQRTLGMTLDGAVSRSA